MRLFQSVLACIVLLSISGCVVPLGNRVTAGHKYPAEALAFLDLPGTTRDEVVATLGPPILESQDTRTLVYAWERTPRYGVFVPDEISGKHFDVHLDIPPVEFDGGSREWGLFIAYDEQGLVSNHQVRKLGTGTLEDACLDLYHRRNTKQ